MVAWIAEAFPGYYLQNCQPKSARRWANKKITSERNSHETQCSCYGSRYQTFLSLFLSPRHVWCSPYPMHMCKTRTFEHTWSPNPDGTAVPPFCPTNGRFGTSPRTVSARVLHGRVISHETCRLTSLTGKFAKIWRRCGRRYDARVGYICARGWMDALQ